MFNLMIIGFILVMICCIFNNYRESNREIFVSFEKRLLAEKKTRLYVLNELKILPEQRIDDLITRYYNLPSIKLVRLGWLDFQQEEQQFNLYQELYDDINLAVMDAIKLVQEYKNCSENAYETSGYKTDGESLINQLVKLENGNREYTSQLNSGKVPIPEQEERTKEPLDPKLFESDKVTKPIPLGSKIVIDRHSKDSVVVKIANPLT